MKRIATAFVLILALVNSSISSASAALTWSQSSTLDTTFDGSLYNSQYDLEYSSAAIFDNNADKISFYLEFAQVPTTKIFDTGKGSFGAIFLDYDFDNDNDFALYAQDITLTTDLSGVKGFANSWPEGIQTYSSCAVSVFTNINENDRWIGFSVSRDCIGLPKTFGLKGLARNDYKNLGKDYDYAPTNYFRVNLPTTTSGGSSSTTVPDVGATFTLPITKANDSKAANSYSDSPQDLSKLSEDLLPSVVTVQCAGGSGTGWSADVTMSTDLQSAGYRSLVVTNHHVIEDCLTSKSVTLVLNSKVTLAGTIVSWSKNDDIAGIAVKSSIPSMQWIGSNPKQGWWVGVLGSPLGVSGILTTGIISSTNSLSSRFTFTAAINPGNSGGPVFDNTGRVLGLATSKNLISTDSIAEGFGNAQGTPLLCSVIVSCVVEKNPWNATPKYAASTSLIASAAAEAAAKIAQDKAVAAAEAAAKIAQDKAVADAKNAAEAAAKIAQDKAVAAAEAAAKIAQDKAVAAAEAAAKIAQDKAVADAKNAAEAAAKIIRDKAVADAKAAAEALAKYESAVANAKAAAEAVAKIEQVIAVAEAKSAAEAAAKIAQDKAVAEAKSAAEAAAKIALDKTLNEAKTEAKAAEAAAKIAQESAASENRTTSELLAKLQNDFSNLSASYANYLSKYNEATSQIEFLQGVVKILQVQVTALLKPKSETIVCTKGTAFKVVKGITPKCPVGFKKN
jgi:hypothetical protein